MCFAFNPLSGYELAKELESNESWYVKISYYLPFYCDNNHGHATVVNQHETRYFDIVYTDMSASYIKYTLNGLCDTVINIMTLKFENINMNN